MIVIAKDIEKQRETNETEVKWRESKHEVQVTEVSLKMETFRHLNHPTCLMEHFMIRF